MGKHGFGVDHQSPGVRESEVYRPQHGVDNEREHTFSVAERAAEVVALGCITDASLGEEDNEHALQLEAFLRESHSQTKKDRLYSNESSCLTRHELPKLEDLSMGLKGSACDCTRILQFFTLPALRFLAFQNFRTTIESCVLVEDFLFRSSILSGRDWKFEKLEIVDHFMPENVLLALVGILPQGQQCIPAVSYYTRRGVRLEALEKAIEVAGDAAWAQGLEYHRDTWGGTWVGRGESSFAYLLP